MRTPSACLNRYIEPIMLFLRHQPQFYTYYRRLVWSITTRFRELGRVGDKFRLLETVLPYTMVGHWELSNVYELCRDVERRRVAGAFVECGVWRGGCSAVMAAVAAQSSLARQVWLFDSFEGLPEPKDVDGENAADYASGRASGALRSIEQCVAPLDDVRTLLFSVLRLDPVHIRIEKGWFQETLPAARGSIGPIAVLRLDCDWYESTRCCLDNLYEKLVPGGYVIIDDYGFWSGCRKAVNEFLQERGVRVKLRGLVPPDMTGEAGVYFQKPTT